MMQNQTTQKQVVDIISVLTTAITNLRLYPQGSAIINNVIDRVYGALAAILDKESPMILAESEKTVLVDGQPLSEDGLKKPQVKVLLELLLSLGIKSITFEKGMERPEIIDLLDIMCTKPGEVHKQGGIQKIISNKNMPHILLDQKIYVALEKDKQIIAGMDIKDEDIIKFVMGDIPYSDIDMKKVREMSKDPEWAAQLFQTGVDNLMKRKGAVSDIKLTETCTYMIHVLDDITDPKHREQLSKSIAGSISGMDDKLLANLLTKNLEDILGAGLFDHIISSLDDAKFERLMTLVKNMAGHGEQANGMPGKTEIESINKAYLLMLNSERTEKLRSSIKESEVLEKDKKKKHAVHIKDGISDILKGNNRPLADKEVIEFLPGLIKQMFSKGKNDYAWTLIDKLGNGLLSEKPEVRIEVSQALSNIGETFLSENREKEMLRLSEKMVNWIKNETSLTPAYKQTCIQLQNLAQELIRKYEINECNRILETFNLIYSGKMEKDETIQILSGNVLKNIATDEILDILLKEFQTNEKSNRKPVAESLSMLGEGPVARLLDILQQSEDRSERLRIIRIVSGIGRHATPALTRQIEQGGDWYYIRNLIALLGRVGTQADLKTLQPFLGYKEFRVQFEALRSIYNIGGESAGKILLSAMAESDDRLNIRIVTMLGTMNYRNAVFPLLDLLKSKSLISSKSRVDLEVNICMALGSIGAQEAIPHLNAIVEQKSLLGIKSYNEKVKIAAGKALAMINKTI